MKQSTSPHMPVLLYLVRSLLLTAACYAAGLLGRSPSFMGYDVSLVWPPTGIALAALLTWGPRYWPAVWLASILINSLTLDLPVALFIAVGNVLAPLVGAVALRRFADFHPAFDRNRDLVAFALLGALGPMTISATLGTLGLLRIGKLTASDFWLAWLNWWLGDATGVLVFSPPLLAWRSFLEKSQWNPRRLAEWSILVAILFTAASILFFGWFGSAADHLPLTFFLFLLLIWIALRFRAAAASQASLLLSLIVLAGTASGKGVFNAIEGIAPSGLLWAFLSMTAILTLLATVLQAERDRVEHRLRESQRFIQAITEASPHIMYVFDIRKQRNIYINRMLARDLGYTADEIQALGPTFLTSLLHPDDAARMPDLLARWETVQDGQILETEHRMRHRDGSWRWFLGRDTVFQRDAEGRVVQIIGTAQDITDRKRAEEALRASQQFILQVTDLLPIYLYVFDLDQLKPVYTNRGSLEFLGYAPEQTQDLSPLKFVHADDFPRLREHFGRLRAAADRQILEVEYRMLHASGQWLWLVSRDMPFQRDAAGQVRQILGAAWDVTERKQAEEALRVSESRFQAYMNHSPLIAFLKDTKGRLLWVNRAFERKFGMRLTDWQGKTDDEIWPPDTARRIRANDEAILAGGEPVEVEETVERPAGVEHWISYKFPFRDAAGQLYLAGMAIDITDRKRAEAALQRLHNELEELVRDRTQELARTVQRLHEAQQQQTALLNSIPDIAWLKDDRSRFIAVNNAFAYSCGFRPEDLPGKTDLDVWPRELAEHYRADDQYVLHSGRSKTIEEPIRDAAGREFWVETVKVPILDGNGTVVGTAGIARDITERRRTEAELRRLNEQLDQLVAERTRALQEEVAERLRIETELRRSQASLETALATARLGAWELHLPSRTGRWSRMMYELYYRDPLLGPPTFQEFQQYIHPEDWEAVVQTQERAVATNEPVVLDYRTNPANGPLRYLTATLQCIDDDEGERALLVGTVLDITDRKQAEEQLRTSLREKEALLKEVHHRVKNNLQIISSLLNLQAATLSDSAVLGVLRESHDRVRSMALVHENLYLSGNMAQIDLAAHVESLCAHLFRSYGVDSNRVRLRLDIDQTSLDLDRAIPCGLIINELISNAIKYAFPNDRAGEIVIRFRVRDGEACTLTVQDTGVGLPPDLDLAHVSSLGLQLVRGLTQQLEGNLAITQEGGTSFTITFPLKPLEGARP